LVPGEVTIPKKGQGVLKTPTLEIALTKS